LNENRKQLQEQGLGLAAISYDTPAILANFAQRKGIQFTLLSDPESKFIKQLGLMNESVPADSFAYGVPHPGTFILDASGSIVSKEFDEDYRERTTVSNLLTQKFNLRTGAAESMVTTKHLRVTASASNAVIRAGEHIRLVLDIEMMPKMHVYAPGVEGYIAIDWTMKDPKGFEPRPVEWPASKKLRLEAIQETVPVYDGRFSLQREIVLAPMPKLQPFLDANKDLIIEGTLMYQACDDRLCYIPQKVPVQWKVHFEPHDPQRVPPELRKPVGKSSQ